MTRRLPAASSTRQRLGRFVAMVLVGGAFSQALLSCARMEAPSGGPEDTQPPVVVSTEPDTFAVMEDFDGPVVFRFSERISERLQGGTVDDAVVVSPPTSPVRVDFQRSALEVSLEEGFEPGRVYRVRVNPVVVDMFSNPMLAPFELVFSTGADYSPGAVAGVVRDRITGDAVSGARVHASPADDPEAAPNVSRTDDDGIFVLRYLPAGSYRILAFQDRNRSGEPDAGEARRRDSLVLATASDTVFTSLEILAPDTTPARVVRIEAVDSSALRIDTDDYLDPSDSLDPVTVTLDRDDGLAPEVREILHAHEWEARRDSLAALTDTTAAGDQPAASGERGPPRSEQSIYPLLDAALEAGTEYVVTVSGIVNINGVPGGGGADTLVWEPPPPDTTSVPADSLDAGGDADPAADDSPPDDPALPNAPGPQDR